MTLGHAIVRLRASTGWTQEEFGKQVSPKRPVTKQSVSFWEDDKNRPLDVHLVGLKLLAEKHAPELVAIFDEALVGVSPNP